MSEKCVSPLQWVPTRIVCGDRYTAERDWGLSMVGVIIDRTGILPASDLDYDVPSVPKAVAFASAATRDAAAGWGSPHGPWVQGRQGAAVIEPYPSGAGRRSLFAQWNRHV